jgi:hypothetical protein
VTILNIGSISHALNIEVESGEPAAAKLEHVIIQAYNSFVA